MLFDSGRRLTPWSAVARVTRHPVLPRNATVVLPRNATSGFAVPAQVVCWLLLPGFALNERASHASTSSPPDSPGYPATPPARRDSRHHQPGPRPAPAHSPPPSTPLASPG